MNIKEYGSRADKTRIEVVGLLKTLSAELGNVRKTVDNIAKTLYNEEYEENND